MNFYNPYFIPMNTVRPSLFSSLFGRINFKSIISNTQKTLNFVNQAIPVFKEISPLVKNTKTIFKVFNEFNKQSISKNKVVNDMSTNDPVYTNGPTFFK